MTPRVAVIGATFGAHYARALRTPSAPAELACIVGAGGRRSAALAADMDVPLRSIEEIGEVDAAVVAVRSALVGGAGDEITRQLLGRGIAVLQELPIHSRDVAESLREARRHGVGFAVNPFYPHLAPVRAFITRTAALQQHSTVHRVLARTCTQTLHATLFVLAQALQGPPPRSAEVFPGRTGHLVRMDWAGSEVDLLIASRLDPDDPDNLAQPLMAYTVSAEDGELQLDHPHASCRWLPRPHVCEGWPLHPDAPSSVVLPPTKEPTIGAALTELWPEAIARALERVLGTPTLPDQRTLAVLRLWESISAELPAPAPARALAPVDRTADLAAIR
ncbi:Gfo/Idh/MocA family oxidoreductase [Helcobacillus massiliensis]|uniref:Thiazolinyl imide reductase n=1 Tax=Helcobacillus massiliensis TaxID=521392 RepID=A0A839R1K4_9MICO|nr:Gfo/Idh/MocA family oxidoreductase [Helcobacillus massiliensis]MBB3023847.1 thiazolinyl imide reductase [Helcobacillus massiliensis]MDK7741406.1 Gfo/Idh/MocA family oxidoreductase [Helcobacillus massiliensis]WOO92747.1 Gfo/Idh/MocA family oxidoreductase [Helcobacillus massiliensis]